MSDASILRFELSTQHAAHLMLRLPNSLHGTRREYGGCRRRLSFNNPTSQFFRAVVQLRFPIFLFPLATQQKQC